MGKGWLIALLSTGIATAHAASFNCAKAATPQEKAICASPELSAADARMAAAYRKLLAAAPPEIKPEIRGGQRAWLRDVAGKCKGADPSAKLAGCLHDSLKARTKALQYMVLHADGVTFVWRSITLSVPDSGGGSISPDEEKKPGFGTLNASWPQAIAATPEWAAWNNAIETSARRIASQDPTAFAEKWLPEWAADNDADITSTIGFVGTKLITASVNGSWWRGAHPSESSIWLNWLLSEKRELRPDDVFVNGSGWDTTIQQRCDQALHHQLDAQTGQDYQAYAAPGEMPKTLHKIVSDPRNWKLDSKGLTIVFQDYAVAPRAAHPDPVTVPWADLKPLMKPDFTIPNG
jgi:uncharacterized protein YecT (DUF1311 family)